MTTHNRYLQQQTISDLREKMVFIGGPRQVGKTMLAISLLDPPEKNHPCYYNWDIIRKQKEILQAEFPTNQKLIVLDEIHKYAKWRNLLKGFYDEFFPKYNFLVTGSARLDHYKKGGDSLVGRYHYLRLHPFSPNELAKQPNSDDIKTLLKFGGFPEPLFKSSETFLRRWQKQRNTRIVREDIRDLEFIKEISLLELLLNTLPTKVGSTLSIRSLQEDLQVAHETISRWIEILDNVYLTFRIPPYGAPKIKAVKKEQKLYFWDWSVIENQGARLENMLASMLLKYCHFLEDTQGWNMELRFIKDKNKHEVDFVVIKNRMPIFAVECKTGEKSLSKSIVYYAERTKIPIFYQVHLGKKDYETLNGKVRVSPLSVFCKEIGLV